MLDIAPNTRSNMEMAIIPIMTGLPKSITCLVLEKIQLQLFELIQLYR